MYDKQTDRLAWTIAILTALLVLYLAWQVWLR